MKKQMGIIAVILTISILLTGCGGKTVEQKNDSLSFYFLSNGNEPWYTAAKNKVLESYPDIGMDIDWWITDQYGMYSSREYKDTDITPLQEYYDKITSDLRKDQAGDIVMGDALYLNWPEATPPDWHKLMKNGAFADLNALAKENGELETTTYTRVNSDKELASENQWTIIPLLYERYCFTTTETLAKQWNFSLPEPNEPAEPVHRDINIVTFLEQCAEWVETYGDDPNAPSIMPDFRFQVLKSVVFDVCGLTIADYESGKVDFDNPTVKRILEALRTISTDIEDSGLGDQGTYAFEQNAYQEKKYLLYGNTIKDVDDMAMLWLRDINDTYTCGYAVRWVAIPSSSKNQTIAYEYIQSLLSVKPTNAGDGLVMVSGYQTLPPERQDPNRKTLNVVLPSTWQYALADLFDSYYAGNMETDEFMNQVQSRLEVYITE
ncbi:hypothetical protein H6A12_03680 [Phocea massiliensis]|uniref:Uncharacterized protein n=1 Tax=Merdimmobilis hominis TaxID=2897707 RepID=A0A939BCM4_9FIRM|nr:hypothetical protein [Merdimmobilis hominis]MBM6920259.1 hypothetical protein [Merdimmobilis hominis]